MASKKDLLLLGLIVIVAAILRLFAYNDLPFTHDEFSSLFRTHFDNFSTLIEQGVKVDEHPAGMQVFLYYWNQIVPESEEWIKAPFILFGLLSVVLIYCLGRTWFTPAAGLYSAAFMAALQYPILHSQTARPYISGLFFILIFTLAWTHLVRKEKPHYAYYFLFILFGALSAYNHYFSMLMAGIIGITGFFVIERRFLKRYLLSSLAIVILFLPHLGIFFHQLSKGGVGTWLGAPSLTFPFDYIGYIFHFSPLLIGVIAGLLAYGIWERMKKSHWPEKAYQWISLTWFLAPMVIGFAYSHLVDPVLHYAVLIFSFPFLLLFIMSFQPEGGFIRKSVLTGVILATSTITLTWEREHYDLYYNSIYEEIPYEQDRYSSIYGDEVSSLIHTSKSITDFYLEREAWNDDFQMAGNIQHPYELDKHLDSLPTSHFFYGTIVDGDPTFLPVIREHYPFLKEQRKLAKGSTKLFSREAEPSINDTIFSASMDLEELQNDESWDNLRAEQVKDTAGLTYKFPSDQEFGPTFRIKGEAMGLKRFHRIEMSAKAFFPETLDELIMVINLAKEGKSRHWYGLPVSDYYGDEVPNNEWLKFHYATILRDGIKDPAPYTLEAYLWNPGENEFLLKNLDLVIRQDNELIYSLTEPFERR